MHPLALTIQDHTYGNFLHLKSHPQQHDNDIGIGIVPWEAIVGKQGVHFSIQTLIPGGRICYPNSCHHPYDTAEKFDRQKLQCTHMIISPSQKPGTD